MFESKTMLWCQCASGSDPQVLRVSYGLQNGVKWFVDNNVRPHCRSHFDATGEKLRILLHLPFGRIIDDSQTIMAINGYTEALKRKATFVYNGFAEQYGKLIEEGHEVIVYLGRPGNTNEFRNELNQPGRRDDVLRKLWECLRLPLEAGCSIAIDNFSSLNRTKLDEGLTQLLAGIGVKTYTESTMEFDSRNDQWWHLPQFIRWPLYKNRHRTNQHPGAVGRFPKWDAENYYGGETTVLIAAGDFANDADLKNAVAEIQSHGNTAALTITRFG